jgi:TonB-dependent receptor
MLHRTATIFGVLIFTSLFFAASVLGQMNASIKGTVKDGQSGEALPSANIMVVGSSLGAVTDIEGRYVIRNVPQGTVTLRASYLGYKALDHTVQVKEGTEVKQDFKLSYLGITGEGVTVTAQAEGQMQAINQQLSSMPVMNVVSAARIQELPDANAAESVSRLPGVSLVRTGGEGSKVVIRGLSPQFNQVTIDGVELPSDVASGNNITSSDANRLTEAGSIMGDRADDLSMISSSMLGGIEVIKAITPDMDATLIGGVVNFGLRKAGKGLSSSVLDEAWFPLIDLRTQGGYNDLRNSYGDYRFTASLERRFLEDRLGVFVQGSSERRNLSANELGASYSLQQKTLGDAPFPDLQSLYLSDVWRRRDRVGGTIVLDYQHESGEIGLMNFVSQSKTHETYRTENIGQTSNDITYSCSDNNNTLNVLSNMFSIKQDLPYFHVDVKLSHSYTESRNPEDLYFNFWQQQAGFTAGSLAKAHPSVLAALAKPNPATTYLNVIQTSESYQKERTLTGNLDLQSDLTISSYLTGKIKFGGMYQYRTRDYDYNQLDGSHYFSGGEAVLNAFARAFPELTANGRTTGSLWNFIDNSYDVGEFLNGDYALGFGGTAGTSTVNPWLMWRLIPYAKVTTSLEGYRKNNIALIINDYYGNETKSAGYMMFTLNVGDLVTILPGVRYQNLATEYTAMRGVTVSGGIQGGDTTVAISHGYWLPMLHLRYKPTEWLQLHFAYTNTLNYPDYSSITPRYLVGFSAISYNNWRIKPARSQNFDIVASIYTNELGLLNINGFKKRIEDLIFFSHAYVSDLSAYPDLPQSTNITYEFNTYINNPVPIDVLGLETEWQTHFWFLPEPFNGIVVNVNYTHIFSEASYPKSEKNVTYDEDGNSVTIINDTTYTTRLLNQPNDILNLSIGYDLGGFAARLSLLYQDNIFKKPDFWMQNRVNSAKFSRWDLSVKQELPWYGIQLFFDINNITGENDVDVNQKNNFPASEQRYGMSADLGLRIRL